MYNDGTGPQYDRPPVIDRNTVRRDEARAAKRQADAEREANWAKYQAFLDSGLSEEDARTGTWPDHALAYLVGADGEEVLAPIDRDGFAILPEGYVAPEDEPDGDDPDESDESDDADSEEDATGDAQGDAPATEDPETPQEPAGDESDPEEADEHHDEPADPEAQAEDDAAAEEIADGIESEDDEEDQADDDAVADEGYDPSAHTVADVQAYLEKNPDQSGYVLDRERAGKARVSLIGA